MKNEQLAEHALDAAAEHALRRSFRVPDGLGAALAARVRAAGAASRPVANASQGGARLRLLRGEPVAALAAAAVLVVLLPRTRSDGADPVATAAAASAGADASAGDLAASSAAPVFPLICGGDPRGGVAAPDLASLYHEVVASAGSGGAQALDCATAAPGDSLLATLRERHGAELRQGSDAGRLAGPFPFAEWSGGTVLAGFPERGGLPSVLVAESAEQLRSCIALAQPRDPDLRLFAWPMGDLVLLEITPEPAPRFLDVLEL